MQSHLTSTGHYEVCRSCSRCIKGKKFVSIPLFSWANGCWFGAVPPELACLTYVEELVIARAHTTKCWAKINAGLPGPLAQRAAHGNICIHPHEISSLATVLPQPISTLSDDIVVIFVTPLLVRRGRILRALQWLKANNHLYGDIEIDMDTLAEYPEENIPFPVQHQVAND
ncbi:hypothetical protein C8J56DRAFT_780085, partial [Mycena floridula]